MTVVSLLMNVPPWAVWPWLGVGLLVTGFLVWRDEHRNLLVSEQKLEGFKLSAPNILIGGVPRIELLYGKVSVVVKLDNYGQAPASTVLVRVTLHSLDGTQINSGESSFPSELHPGQIGTQLVIGLTQVPSLPCFVAITLTVTSSTTGDQIMQSPRILKWRDGGDGVLLIASTEESKLVARCIKPPSLAADTAAPTLQPSSPECPETGSRCSDC